MPIPEYHNFILPLLRLAGDKKEHSLADSADALAVEFGLTDEDRSTLLPSGMQPKFDNRVGWARTYLKKAHLIDSTGRGKFQITPRGLEVLQAKPTKIDAKYLMRFPEFREFINPPTEGPQPSSHIEPQTDEGIGQTPEEMLESSYQSLRRELAQELLERVKSCSPRFFEKLVVDLLVSMGYGGSRKDAGQAIGKSGDDGVDGVIKEDKLGLDVLFLQAKRWEVTVGRPVVQAFAGSLEGQRARKGILITTSKFSAEAVEYVGRIEKKIVLIDGHQLAQLMIDHGVGVTELTTYTIKRMDLDYFGEE